MLQPARRKYRKEQKGRNTGLATRGAKVSFGEYGLKAIGRGRLTARQIEAARRAMTRHIKRGGRIWIRIFPDKPISKKPLRCGWVTARAPRSTGSPRFSPARYCTKWTAWTRPLAREAFRLAAAKLPLETTFVTRHLG
jgi:large subunit ribosomal protein L16